MICAILLTLLIALLAPVVAQPPNGGFLQAGCNSPQLSPDAGGSIRAACGPNGPGGPQFYQLPISDCFINHLGYVSWQSL
jgi:hypothetical protein